MHSSRMLTAHLLPVSPSMHGSGGVPAWGVYLFGEVYLPRGVPARGCTCQGVYLPGGRVYPPGVYLPMGGTCPVPACGGVPAWWGGVPAQVLPPVNRMTDRQV